MQISIQNQDPVSISTITREKGEGKGDLHSSVYTMYMEVSIISVLSILILLSLFMLVLVGLVNYAPFGRGVCLEGVLGGAYMVGIVRSGVR